MPILGVVASSTRQGQNVDAGVMFALQSIVIGSAGASSITFRNIPQTYTHLQIRGIARSNRNAANDSVFMQYNADTGLNYSVHTLNGTGAAMSLYGSPANTESNFTVGQISSLQSNAGVFGGFVIDILDYANTNKYKTQRSFGGFDNNGSGVIAFSSGSWRSFSAITSIVINAHPTNTYQQYSTFALYGIKGA
jgi:hypothetical protein